MATTDRADRRNDTATTACCLCIPVNVNGESGDREHEIRRT